MKNEKELKKIWAQVPPDYYQKGISENFLRRYWHTQKLLTLKKLVAKNDLKKILDVGCASGRMTNEISKIFPKAKITGVDVYSKAINFGRHNYSHIKFLVADAHKLPFKDKTFDLIVCYETIEHVIEPTQILREIRRVMDGSGQAIIAMDSGNLMFRIVWWIWEKTAGKVWQGAHLHPFKHEELENAIKKSGLKILKKHFSHFGMEVSFVVRR